MKQHKDCNFSYAGLKTQVKLAIESRKMYVACDHKGEKSYAYPVSWFFLPGEFYLICTLPHEL